MKTEEYMKTIPTEGWVLKNIPLTVETAYQDGKRSMDSDWRSVMHQFCETHNMNYHDFIREINQMLTDLPNAEGGLSEKPAEEKSTKFYLINVLGKDGYSFMVKTEMDDADEIIAECARRDLFNDEHDIWAALVDEADEHDQSFFKEYTDLDSKE